MPAHSEAFWMGFLANTAAIASREPDPRPVLKSALRDFLRDHPPGHVLGDTIRATLKEKR